MKPELKFEGGKLLVKAAHAVDTDKDGVSAVEAAIELKIDALEAITEIAKKDLPFLKAILEKVMPQ